MGTDARPPFIQFQRASTAFHSTNKKKKKVYNTKFTLLEGPKIYVLNFNFREISPNIYEITKTSIKLNHLSIRIRKL